MSWNVTNEELDFISTYAANLTNIADVVISPVTEISRSDSKSTKNLATSFVSLETVGRFGEPVISNFKLGSYVASTLMVAFFTPKSPNGPSLSRAYDTLC